MLASRGLQPRPGLASLGHARHHHAPPATCRPCSCHHTRRPSPSNRRLPASFSGSGGGNGPPSIPPVAFNDSSDPNALPGRWKVLLLIAIGASASIINDSLYKPAARASPTPVSIIIPTAPTDVPHSVSQTVTSALRLHPAPLEVIVVVPASSSDGNQTTATLATQAGARVVPLLTPTPAPTTTASQLNAGAAEARGGLLAFLPAGACPPPDLVAVLRHELSRPTTLLLGFRPSFRNPQQQQQRQRTLHLLSAHALAQAWYLPLLTHPLAFVRGLRLPSTRQLLSCRKDDFQRASGFSVDFDPAVDHVDQELTGGALGADLCMRLHSVAARQQAVAGAPQGRIKVLINREVVTYASGHLSPKEELQATWRQLSAGFQWSLGRWPRQQPVARPATAATHQ